MELTFLVAALTIFEAVGYVVGHETRGMTAPLVRKRRFFDDDDLEGVESHLGEKIGTVCPAAKHWFDAQHGGDDHHRTLGHGDAIHLAIKIRRLKKAITLLCREHTTTQKPHKPTHKPRPTHRPPYRPPYSPPNRPPYSPPNGPPYRPPTSIPYPPRGAGLLPDQVVRNLEVRRYVIRPLRQLFGWPVGVLASALLLN